MKKVSTIQQVSICLQPLQCSHHRQLRQLAEKDMLENSCILVANVGSFFHLRTAYVPI